MKDHRLVQLVIASHLVDLAKLYPDHWPILRPVVTLELQSWQDLAEQSRHAVTPPEVQALSAAVDRRIAKTALDEVVA